jgi:hypothetical protein
MQEFLKMASHYFEPNGVGIIDEQQQARVTTFIAISHL